MYVNNFYQDEDGNECVGFNKDHMISYVKDMISMLTEVRECFEDIIETCSQDPSSFEDEDQEKFEDSLSFIYGKSELGILRIEELEEVLEEITFE